MIWLAKWVLTVAFVRKKDMGIKLVIFDVDGLLLNTEFVWDTVWKNVADKYNEPRFYDLHKYAVGITGKETEDLITNNLPDVENPLQMLQEARDTGAQLLKKEVAVMPGVFDFLEYLKANNFSLAVATTTPRNLTMERLTQTGLLRYFTVIVCGDEVKRRKPDPEIYTTVLKKTGYSADEAIVFEDTGYGVTAAYNANIRPVMVPSLRQPNNAEKAMCFDIIDNLSEGEDLVRKIVNSVC